MNRITFQMLRELVGSTKGLHLPTAKALRESGVPVVTQKEASDSSITVYENGFYTYHTPSGTTVYAVDRCGDYAYDGGDALAEAQIACEDWSVRLVLAGEDRLEHNNDAREQGNHFSYSHDATERSDLRDEHDFVEAFEHRDMVERMLDCLTEKQRQIVHLYFFEGLTQQQIQAQLGLSRGALLDRLNSAINKMKKILE